MHSYYNFTILNRYFTTHLKCKDSIITFIVYCVAQPILQNIIIRHLQVEKYSGDVYRDKYKITV